MPNNIVSSIKVHRGGINPHNHHTVNEGDNLNSSEDFQGQEGGVEEHFASHQDIRSQLNKIMKVGILSHSDDVQQEELPGANENQEILESPSPEGGLVVRDSLNENLQEMALLERQIEVEKSIEKTVPSNELKVAKATFKAARGNKFQ